MPKKSVKKNKVKSVKTVKSVRKTQKDRTRIKSTRKDKKDKKDKSVRKMKKMKKNQRYIYKKDGRVYYLEKVDTTDPTDREEWERHQDRCFSYVTPLDDELYTHFKFINQSGKILAYCTVILHDTIDRFSIGIVEDLYHIHSLWNVCSTTIEKGVCTKMISSLLTHRKRIFKDTKPIVLSVYSDNTPAIKCYEKVGFKQFMQKNNIDYMMI